MKFIKCFLLPVLAISFLSGCSAEEEPAVEEVHVTNAEEFLGKNYDKKVILDNDIDLGGASFTESISAISIEGNGHAIKNANFSNGKFGKFDFSMFHAQEIANLVIDNITFNTSGTTSVGVLTHSDTNKVDNVTIENCKVTCTGANKYKDFYYGTLVSGVAIETDVDYSKVNKIIRKDVAITNCKIDNVEISVNGESKVDNSYYVGIGLGYGAVNGLVVTNSSVKVKHHTYKGNIYLGGAIGEGTFIKNAEVSNCKLESESLTYNKDILGAHVLSQTYVGGITGFMNAKDDLENEELPWHTLDVSSAHDNEINAKCLANAYVGGIIGRSRGLVNQVVSYANKINTSKYLYPHENDKLYNRHLGGVAGIMYQGYIESSISYNNAIKDDASEMDELDKIFCGGLIGKTSETSSGVKKSITRNNTTTSISNNDEFCPSFYKYNNRDCYVTEGTTNINSLPIYDLNDWENDEKFSETFGLLDSHWHFEGGLPTLVF